MIGCLRCTNFGWVRRSWEEKLLNFGVETVEHHKIQDQPDPTHKKSAKKNMKKQIFLPLFLFPESSLFRGVGWPWTMTLVGFQHCSYVVSKPNRSWKSKNTLFVCAVRRSQRFRRLPRLGVRFPPMWRVFFCVTFTRTVSGMQPWVARLTVLSFGRVAWTRSVNLSRFALQAGGGH